MGICARHDEANKAIAARQTNNHEKQRTPKTAALVTRRVVTGLCVHIERR
jgi:hypothetical protein